MKASVLLFLLLISGSSLSQNYIEIDSNYFKTSITEKVAWVTDANNIWLTYGLDSCQSLNGFKDYSRNAFVHRQLSNPVILKFELATSSLTDSTYVLSFSNTELDKVQLLIIDDLGNKSLSTTIGDANLFDNRYFGNRILAIPISLESDRKYTCLLGIEKKNRVISSRIELSQKSYWQEKSLNHNFIYGLLLGPLLILVVISFSLFILLKQLVHFYYSLYVVFVFLLLATLHGFSYQYLYPQSPEIQQDFPLIVQLSSFIFSNLYAFSFINFQHHTRTLGTIKRVFIGLYIVALAAVLLGDFIGQILEQFLVRRIVLVYLLNSLFLLAAPLIYYVLYRKKEAIVYFISYLLVGLSIFYTMLSFSFSSLDYIQINQSLMVGSLLEMLILSIFMIINYKNLESKKIRAENDITQERLKGQHALIDGQEIEKRKIALNLHDNIGSSVLGLKLKIESLVTDSQINREIVADITKISREIRNVGHELLPVTLEEFGLSAAIMELISKNENISFHFNEPSRFLNLTKETSIQLYRIIQELIKNTQEHANANNVSIQLYQDDCRFELTYEDDGRGFNEHKITKGIGFSSIQTRVLMLNGNISYDSAEGKGVLILIDIPI